MSNDQDNTVYNSLGIREQYKRLASDWRHINTIMWGIPAVAVSIVAGVMVVAYRPELEGWPRVTVLGLCVLLLLALSVESIKKRLLMDAISARLQNLEKDSKLEKFTPSTRKLIEYVKQNPNEHQANKDPVYNLFIWSHARQNLTYVIFVAAIAISILTEWEFIKYFPYPEWALSIGIAPVAAISIAFGYWRYKKNKKSSGKTV